jgi:hypothetical protein
MALIIEDVPIESVKNVNTNIKNKNKSNILYKNFSLIGLIQETAIEVTPSYYKFPETLSINTSYKYHDNLDILYL